MKIQFLGGPADGERIAVPEPPPPFYHIPHAEPLLLPVGAVPDVPPEMTVWLHRYILRHRASNGEPVYYYDRLR